uniref:MARVEL domain-containing protein n=1 Tax=Elaeophora elaphi TaxID=1147741 RepID=A0A0R3RNP9_9BILA
MEENLSPHSSGNGGSTGIFAMFGLTLSSATILCTFAQIGLTLASSLYMYTYLPYTVVNSILITLSVFCCGIAIVFLLTRAWERIFSSMYDSFFHGYLLSMVGLFYFITLYRLLIIFFIISIDNMYSSTSHSK